jgi:SAM-dependent methyltransferase
VAGAQGEDHRAAPSAQSRADEFDAAYQGVPPWDIGRPQKAFADLVATGVVTGPVLDVGCGTGEHALMAATLGLVATGIDISPRAIEIAERKAGERALDARFLVGDALGLEGSDGRFDTVLDCGLFHTFDDLDRVRFVRSLGAVTAPGGRYLMLCFSDREPGDWGPRRIHREEITSAFAEGWRIEAVEPSRIGLTTRPDGAQAWLATITRR